jgi:hypothetical protein
MANIKINDLQPAEFELRTLSDLEIQCIVGGDFWSDLVDTVTDTFHRVGDELGRIGRQIDRFVRHNVRGGWWTVAQNVLSNSGHSGHGG